MSNQQTRKVTGNVYRIEAYQFAIVDYQTGTARVRVALLESETSHDAIDELSLKFPNWDFVHADSDTQKWGDVCMRRAGHAMLFSN